MASFFIWASLASFIIFIRPESHPDLWGNHSLHHPFLTWDNALIMKIITLLFTYNSRITTRYLEQNMTLYECLQRCTDQKTDKPCKHHASYLTIMQSNMTMMKRVIINGTVVSCMANISWNGYGNAIIRMYGGCFEEGIWWV